MTTSGRGGRVLVGLALVIIGGAFLVGNLTDWENPLGKLVAGDHHRRGSLEPQAEVLAHGTVHHRPRSVLPPEHIGRLGLLHRGHLAVLAGHTDPGWGKNPLLA